MKTGGIRLALVGIAALFQATCSALFWRDAVPQRTISWAGGRDFVEVRVSYREKNAFDPTVGTTLKKDYQSELYRIPVAVDDTGNLRGARVDRPEKLYSMPGWILDGSVYALSGGLLFLGAGNDEYGGLRNLYLLRAGRAQKLLEPDEKKLLITHAVPSPDGRHVAIVDEPAPGQGGRLAFRLRLAAWSADGTRLEFPRDGARGTEPFGEGPVWRSDSSGVSFRTVTKTFFLGVTDDFERGAATFPRCFQPKTNSGGPVSDDRLRVSLTEDSENFEVSLVPDWIPFAALPYTGDSQQVGQSCP